MHCHRYTARDLVDTFKDRLVSVNCEPADAIRELQQTLELRLNRDDVPFHWEDGGKFNYELHHGQDARRGGSGAGLLNAPSASDRPESDRLGAVAPGEIDPDADLCLQTALQVDRVEDSDDQRRSCGLSDQHRLCYS